MGCVCGQHLVWCALLVVHACMCLKMEASVFFWYAALPDVGMSSDSGKYTVGVT